jgi:hypothetical protein
MASSSGHSIPVAIKLDPIIDLQATANRVYLAKLSGGTQSRHRYTSQTQSNTEANWEIAEDMSHDIDRRVLIKYQVRATFFADRAGKYDCGLRAYPLAKVTNTIEFKPNEVVFTHSPKNNIDALMHYGTSPDARNRFASTFPSFQDQYQALETVLINQGGARQPFAYYGSNNLEVTRLAEEWGTWAADGLSWTSHELYEPLYLSSFNWGDQEVPGLSRIRRFSLTLKFDDLRRMWSDGLTVAECATHQITDMSFVNLLELHTFVQTPNYIPRPIPDVLIYPYYRLTEYQQTIPAAASGTVVQVQMPLIKLGGVPNRMYIVGRPNYGSMTEALASRIPDIYTRINGITMQWDNSPNRLADCSSRDLYMMSIHNGNDQTWQQWSTYQGSIGCLVPGKDFPLDKLGDASGVKGDYQVQMSISMTLLHETGGNLPYVAYLNVIDEGFQSITKTGDIYYTVNPLTNEAVMSGSVIPIEADVKIGNFYGGGKFLDGLKKALKVGSKILAPIGAIASLIPHPTARAIGTASGIASGAMGVLGGKRGTRRGGALEIDRSELHDRASV